MAVSKQKKTEILENLKKDLENSKSVAFTQSNTLSVDDFSKLRTSLREVNAKLILAKKTLIKIAMKDIYDVELNDEYLPGQIWVLLSFDDEVAWMWKAREMIKELWEEKITWASSFLDGNINDSAQTKLLASLPSKETLLGKLVGTMNAPLQKFVGTLSSVPGSFVRVVDSAKWKVEETGKEKLSEIVA